MKKIIIDIVLSFLSVVGFALFSYILLWYANEVGIPT